MIQASIFLACLAHKPWLPSDRLLAAVNVGPKGPGIQIIMGIGGLTCLPYTLNPTPNDFRLFRAWTLKVGPSQNRWEGGPLEALGIYRHDEEILRDPLTKALTKPECKPLTIKRPGNIVI